MAAEYIFTNVISFFLVTRKMEAGIAMKEIKQSITKVPVYPCTEPFYLSPSLFQTSLS